MSIPTRAALLLSATLAALSAQAQTSPSTPPATPNSPTSPASPMAPAASVPDSMRQGATRNGEPVTAPGLPPGATSTRGNKAAVPASGAGPVTDPVNPATGSTPGMPPGARSATGDKAQTPRGKGVPASSPGSAPR